MIRQILIVHNSEAIVRTLQSTIDAEINDAAVFTAETVEEAIESVRMFNIHLILYSPTVSSENIIDVYHKIQPLAADLNVPMLILTAGESSGQYDAAIEAGVSGCLELPCAAPFLCRAIDRICSPQRLRGARRYSIPRTSMQLSQPGCRLAGRVINISEGGLLCQIDEPGGFEWAKPSSLILSFELAGERLQIAEIEAVPVNVNVVRSHADYSPAQVRVAFRFVELPPSSKQQIGEIFAQLDSEQRLVSLAI